MTPSGSTSPATIEAANGHIRGNWGRFDAICAKDHCGRCVPIDGGQGLLPLEGGPILYIDCLHLYVFIVAVPAKSTR